MFIQSRFSPTYLAISVCLLYAACLFLSACDPDGRDRDYPTYYMSADFKSYTVFPKGSYWVYEEINSGTIDSVYLFESEIFPPDPRSGPDEGFSNEFLQMNFKSSFTNDTIVGFGYPGQVDRTSFFYYEFHLSDFINQPLIFFDNKPVGFEIRYVEGFVAKFQSESESLTVGNLIFDNVRMFEHNVQFFSYQSQRVYFSKDIGIIKRELFNGQVWNLIRYYIPK